MIYGRKGRKELEEKEEKTGRETETPPRSSIAGWFASAKARGNRYCASPRSAHARNRPRGRSRASTDRSRDASRKRGRAGRGTVPVEPFGPSVGTLSGWLPRSIRDLQLRNEGSGSNRKERETSQDLRRSPGTSSRWGWPLVSQQGGRMPACFRAEAAVASAGSRSYGRAVEERRRRWRTDESTRRNAKRSSAGARTSARLARVIYSFLAWRGERAERRGEARALPAKRK